MGQGSLELLGTQTSVVGFVFFFLFSPSAGSTAANEYHLPASFFPDGFYMDFAKLGYIN